MKNMKHNKIREGEAEKEETEPLWPHLGFFIFLLNIELYPSVMVDQVY